MENINLFDIIVIGLIAILGLKGLFRGLIKELFGIIGIVGGVFIASRLAKNVGDLVNSIIPMENENTILLAGFVASIAVFWIAAYFIGAIIAKIFSISGLGIFDKIFGFAFGAGKIFLLFAIISYAISQVKMINDNLQPKLQDSIMFPILKDSGSYIIKLDTSNIQEKVTKKLDSVVDGAKETMGNIAVEELEKQLKEPLSEK